MRNTPQIKVILDSDVIIHFIKGDWFNLLPSILPAYSFVILDVVYERELAVAHISRWETYAKDADVRIEYRKQINESLRKGLNFT